MCLACAGCRSLPLSLEAPTRRLRIDNPERVEIELSRVGGPRCVLGSGRTIELELQAARYVVHGRGEDYPAPLVAGAANDGAAMVVAVTPRPDVPPGFVFIPGGPTLIGDVLGVGAVDERPPRIVDVAPFLVAAAETTNAQYVEFLNARRACDDDWIDLGGPKCRIRRAGDGGFVTDAPRLPVVTVSHPGATEYCAWKTRTTGREHRLPSEVEWERMARGPSSATYAYGDVYDPEAANQESGVLVGTRSFRATGWGVYDATGNAFEWTSTDYQPGLKVLRGGSFVLDGPYLRNSFRMWYRPLVQADDIGFRVVREIER